MIIKLIAETEEEKKHFEDKGLEEIVHAGVRDFLVFGNKSGNNEREDFHEWNGSYRYLMGSLNYFYQFINDERKKSGYPMSIKKNINALSEEEIGMIKRGSAQTVKEPIKLEVLNNEDLTDNESSINI